MLDHFLITNRVNSEISHFKIPFKYSDSAFAFVRDCLDGESLIYEFKGFQQAFHLDGSFNTCLKVGMTIENLIGDKSSFFLYFHNDVNEDQICTSFMGKIVNGIMVNKITIFKIQEVLK